MLIVLNNKCHFTKEEYLKYQQELNNNIKDDFNIVLCPPTLYLSIANTDKIILGSQNVSKNECGPHTGEISASQLKSIGINYCLVGHSERRSELIESISDIKEKIRQLLKVNIIPIVCIGENLEENKKGLTEKVLQNDLNEIIKDLSEKEIEELIIVYEPVWAIGSNKLPKQQELLKSINSIKKILPKNQILYGGGLTDINIISFKNLNIDGFLIGNSSLYPEKINHILNTLKY